MQDVTERITHEPVEVGREHAVRSSEVAERRP